jgi:hypothetical protein
LLGTDQVDCAIDRNLDNPGAAVDPGVAIRERFRLLVDRVPSALNVGPLMGAVLENTVRTRKPWPAIARVSRNKIPAQDARRHDGGQ